MRFSVGHVFGRIVPQDKACQDTTGQALTVVRVCVCEWFFSSNRASSRDEIEAESE